MLAVALLVVAIASLLWAMLGQVTMNEFSRTHAWATNDASRVMEQLRRQHSGGSCVSPSIAPPLGFVTWDAWLADTGAGGGGGKSVQPDPAANELVVVSSTGSDPLTVAVAVCWRHRARVIGECTWNGAVLDDNPAAGGDPVLTESPAMLLTLLTCRQG
jgi:hypothetical protein